VNLWFLSVPWRSVSVRSSPDGILECVNRCPLVFSGHLLSVSKRLRKFGCEVRVPGSRA
jgi:hypothetical protein